jgi:hypothetical protein
MKLPHSIVIIGICLLSSCKQSGTNDDASKVEVAPDVLGAPNVIKTDVAMGFEPLDTTFYRIVSQETFDQLWKVPGPPVTREYSYPDGRSRLILSYD